MLLWLRYQLRKLLRPRVITNGGVRIDLGPAAGTRYARAFYRDAHERDEREIVSRHLRPDDVVLELGAGLGLVTILCCQRTGSDRVHTFEANPDLAAALRRNFAINGVAPQLHLRMVTRDGGPREFFVAERFIQSSGHAAVGASTAGAATKVDSVPLADVLATVRPTFLIADVEGGELELFESPLALEGVRSVCLEVHPHIIDDGGVSRVIAALLSRGFELRVRDCRGDVLYFARPAVAAAGSAAGDRTAA